MKKLTLNQIENRAKKFEQVQLNVKYNGNPGAMLELTCSPSKDLYYFISLNGIGRREITRSKAQDIVNQQFNF